jgi:SPOR domain
MPTMVTFHARRVAIITLLSVVAAACSREQQDWRAAEGADTSEAWARFIEQHPDSELAPQAHARIAAIAEASDWQRATSVATVAAYREFLSQHPTGTRAEDARIRIEAFSLGSAPRIDHLPAGAVAAASHVAAGVPALQIATGTAAPAPASRVAQSDSAPADAGVASGSRTLAVAGEAAQAQAIPGEAAQAAPAALETTGAVYTAAASGEAPAAAGAVATAAAGATAPLTADASGYGVQLGAFGSEASADHEWQRLQGRFTAQLGGLSPRIILTSTSSGQLYRLQVAAAGEAQARAICDSLKEQSQPCVPVLPQTR